MSKLCDMCDKLVFAGNLCRFHYIEYLKELHL